MGVALRHADAARWRLQLLDPSDRLILAQEFLVVAQSADGFWRDFMLPPGESEAWTTSCAGVALAQPPEAEWASQARRAACEALQRVRAPAGWGYNRATAADADSTAWTIAYLALEGELRDVDAVGCLERYVEPSGLARTFDSRDLFGAWGAAHADVTPVVGMALLAAGSDGGSVERIRAGCLESGATLWQAYWWDTDAYAIARNLEFLAASGGVPQHVADKAHAWLRTSPPARTAFEAAQYLSVAALLGLADTALGESLLRALLDQQMEDGGWPPSRVLRVPAQDGGPSTRLYEDGRRSFGTAHAILALKRALSTAAATPYMQTEEAPCQAR